jgi:16S rRNA processing protein RimM
MTASFDQPQEYVAVGAVRRPFGVRGQCYVEAIGETLSRMKRGSMVRAGIDAAKTTRLTICDIRDTDKGLVIRFEGYDDCDQVGQLRGFLLFCAKNDLPALSGGRHYHFELEGMTVVAQESGREIGVVTGVISFPTVEALEVLRKNGQSVYISLSRGIVHTIDRATRRIVVAETMLDEVLQ